MARLQPGTVLIVAGFGLLWLWQKTQNLLARLLINFGGFAFSWDNWSPKIQMNINSPLPTSITIDSILGSVKNSAGVVLANYYVIGPIQINPGQNQVNVTLDIQEGNLIGNLSASSFAGATFFYTITSGPLSLNSSYQYA